MMKNVAFFDLDTNKQMDQNCVTASAFLVRKPQQQPIPGG